ncbi:hypothetical protein ABH935_007980 [Catenulispora sp. GAS73]
MSALTTTPAATTPAGSTTRADHPHDTATQPCAASGLEASR